MARRKTRASVIVAALQSWSHSDSQLAGMPDPLANEGPSDEIVKLWEQSFYAALASDREYWQDRDIALGIPPAPVIKSDEEIMLELMYPTRPIVSSKPLINRVLDALLRR